MKLRHARLENDDCELFYRNRRRDEDRGIEQGYYLGKRTTHADHNEWYGRAFASDYPELYICWPLAGTVRVESNGEIAVSAPDHNLPALLVLVKPLAANYGGRLKLTIDQDNTTLAKAADLAGWTEHPVKFYAHRTT